MRSKRVEGARVALNEHEPWHNARFQAETERLPGHAVKRIAVHAQRDNAVLVVRKREVPQRAGGRKTPRQRAGPTVRRAPAQTPPCARRCLRQKHGIVPLQQVGRQLDTRA